MLNKLVIIVCISVPLLGFSGLSEYKTRFFDFFYSQPSAEEQVPLYVQLLNEIGEGKAPSQKALSILSKDCKQISEDGGVIHTNREGILSGFYARYERIGKWKVTLGEMRVVRAKSEVGQHVCIALELKFYPENSDPFIIQTYLAWNRAGDKIGLVLEYPLDTVE